MCSCCADCRWYCGYICWRTRSQISSTVEIDSIVDVTKDLYPDQIIYALTSILICYAETLRLLTFLQLKNDAYRFILSFIANICTETLSRNNLNYKFLYEVINKIGDKLNIQLFKNLRNPDLTRTYSIYYGAKLQIEYTPLIIVTLYNIFGYGPSSACNNLTIPLNIDVNQNDLGYWILVIIFFMELLSDIAGELVRYGLIHFKIIEKNDPRHRVIHISLTVAEIVAIAACGATWAHNAMYFDCTSHTNC